MAVEQSQRFLGIVHHIMHPPTASGVQSDRTHLEVRARRRFLLVGHVG